MGMLTAIAAGNDFLSDFAGIRALSRRFEVLEKQDDMWEASKA